MEFLEHRFLKLKKLKKSQTEWIESEKTPLKTVTSTATVTDNWQPTTEIARIEVESPEQKKTNFSGQKRATRRSSFFGLEK